MPEPDTEAAPAIADDAEAQAVEAIADDAEAQAEEALVDVSSEEGAPAKGKKRKPKLTRKGLAKQTRGSKRRQQHSVDFKRSALEKMWAMSQDRTVTHVLDAVAEELHVDKSLLCKWNNAAETILRAADADNLRVLGPQRRKQHRAKKALRCTRRPHFEEFEKTVVAQVQALRQSGKRVGVKTISKVGKCLLQERPPGPIRCAAFGS